MEPAPPPELLPVSGSIRGLRVLVTGCASGIGLATVQLLAAEGARLVGVDRHEPPVPMDEWYPCDLGDPEAIDHLVARLDGALHGVCNAAGLPTTRPAADIMRVNLFGLRHLTERLLPRLEDGASVVNIASCAGTGWPKRLDVITQLLATDSMAAGLAEFAQRQLDPVEAYFLSKEAVTVYTMVTATKHVDRRIRVNAVSPGAVYTPILDDFYTTMDADRLAELRTYAGGREGYPAEIAAPIAFLLSRAASWVNGTNLIVDGGAETAVTLGTMAERTPNTPRDI
ncbi:coniferyl-alcohol dehydrogenase [Candidatus Poriferisocius sp.]|uniref:coniferyl-alcohol dehydrogenase n=1 Tax=Candidatus Poriferisocius sp. TaxID=3101276 RepID=UPI003B5C773A